MSLIAKIVHKEHGLALSAAYYHLSDNRDAYCNDAKKIRAVQRVRIQERIHTLIEDGWNTEMIANDWNIPLRILNKIYTT